MCLHGCFYTLPTKVDYLICKHFVFEIKNQNKKMASKNYINFEVFRCTNEELDRIRQEMQILGFTKKSEYYRYKILKQQHL